MIIRYTSRIPTEKLIVRDTADLSVPGNSYKVYHGQMVHGQMFPGFDPTIFPCIGTIHRTREGLYFEPNPEIVGSPSDERS